jgi:hypothetical protein
VALGHEALISVEYRDIAAVPKSTEQIAFLIARIGERCERLIRMAS